MEVYLLDMPIEVCIYHFYCGQLFEFSPVFSIPEFLSLVLLAIVGCVLMPYEQLDILRTFERKHFEVVWDEKVYDEFIEELDEWLEPFQEEDLKYEEKEYYRDIGKHYGKCDYKILDAIDYYVTPIDEESEYELEQFDDDDDLADDHFDDARKALKRYVRDWKAIMPKREYAGTYREYLEAKRARIEAKRKAKEKERREREEREKAKEKK